MTEKQNSESWLAMPGFPRHIWFVTNTGIHTDMPSVFVHYVALTKAAFLDFFKYYTVMSNCRHDSAGNWIQMETGKQMPTFRYAHKFAHGDVAIGCKLPIDIGNFDLQPALFQQWIDKNYITLFGLEYLEWASTGYWGSAWYCILDAR